jgi:LssY C-terminus
MVGPMTSAPIRARPPHPGPRRAFLHALAAAVVAYPLAAYVLVPLGWRRLERQPPLTDAPRITRTASGIPGDPVNLCLIGSQEELVRAMVAAGWVPADPITLRTALRIAADTLLRRPYEEAPVSSLYLWGHRQDLAFEEPVGGDPRERHHVRFWRADAIADGPRPRWLGAATFDVRVGLSHTTGQVTHHIAADVDAERDRILSDIERIGALQDVTWIAGFQWQRQGRNGGGDIWRTDGSLPVGVLSLPGRAPSAQRSPRSSVTRPAGDRAARGDEPWARHRSLSSVSPPRSAPRPGPPVRRGDAALRPSTDQPAGAPAAG